jgi:uncharacterized spore protein YtfJ
MKILDQVKDVVTGATVFGAPYEKNGVTVIPAVKVSGGGGGGQDAGEAGGAGVGLDARPAGAFVIKGDEVSWVPAIDVNRLIFMGQVVLLAAILSWRSVARQRARRR